MGFASFDIKLSTRPEQRAGSDEIWDKAEAALEAAVRKVTNDYERRSQARARSTDRSSTSS